MRRLWRKTTASVPFRVLNNPGVIMAGVSVLFFWGTPLAALACGVAAVAGAASETLRLAAPDFLKRHPRLAEIACAPGTTMRLCSGAMVGCVLGLLHKGLTKGGGGGDVMQNVIYPAIDSTMFAIADQMIGGDRDRAGHNPAPVQIAPVKTPLTAGKVASGLFKRPTLYIGLGFGMVGLMSGALAQAVVLPLVGLSVAVGLRNIFQDRQPHEGHPNIISAASALVFAVSAIRSHPRLTGIGICNAVTFWLLTRFDGEATPGGLRGVARDVAGGVRDIAARACAGNEEAGVIASLQSGALSSSFDPRAPRLLLAAPALQPESVPLRRQGPMATLER